MKILMLNLGYARGWDGSFWGFWKTFYRFPFQLFFQRKKELQKLEHIIKKEDPDIILLTEIENKKCIKYLSNLGYPFFDMSIKYGKKSFYRMIPAWHNNSNAFLSKKQLDFKIEFFNNGVKKLIYKIYLPNGFILYFVHLSLLYGTRKKQIIELQKRVIDDKVLVVGDFNILRGVSEIRQFLENKKMKLSSTEYTYPSFNPVKNLDIFLIPKNILKYNTRVFRGEDMSDHLPIILEVDL